MHKSWQTPGNRKLRMGADYAGDLFGPDTVRNEQRIVDGLVDALDRDIESSDTANDTFKAQWASFRDEWKTFLADNDDVLSQVLNKTYATTLEYRDRVAAWRKRFIMEGGSPSTPETPPPQTYGGFPLKKLAIGAGLVGAGILAWRMWGKSDER